MLKKILLFLLVALIVIQFFRPAKNDSRDFSKDISRAYVVPPDVQLILQRACYDCHSNNTTYPWYSNFQPVAWWLQHHVDEGKQELNFSDFAAYSKKRQAHKMEEVAEQVSEHEMPLPSYTWMHPLARLDTIQRRVLIDWATNLQKQIEATDQ